MAFMNKKGYISPKAEIDHSQLRTGNHVFIGDQVKIMEGAESGYIDLGERVELHRELYFTNGARRQYYNWSAIFRARRLLPYCLQRFDPNRS